MGTATGVAAGPELARAAHRLAAVAGRPASASASGLAFAHVGGVADAGTATATVGPALVSPGRHGAGRADPDLRVRGSDGEDLQPRADVQGDASLGHLRGAGQSVP